MTEMSRKKRWIIKLTKKYMKRYHIGFGRAKRWATKMVNGRAGRK